MRVLRSLPLYVFFAFLLSAAAAIAQQSPIPSQIVNPIDEKHLITLKGTVHPLANARNDGGAAPDEMRLDRMHLVLHRSNAREMALKQLISDLHTPGTASYHKWLTPDAFGKQFGPSDEDIATVETWLTGHGFNVAKVTPGKQVIEFSGNVGQFRSAFHAQIHKYLVKGETHYANAADPQIPTALAPVVSGFASLNNFRAKSYVKPLGKAQYDPKTDHATPEWTVGNETEGFNFVVAPGDYAVQYDLTPLYTAGVNGTGQSIAIVNESNINIYLVNQFRSLFGLPANPPQVIIDGNDPGVDGINNPDGPNGASVEAYLDVEWAGAVAPKATVDLVIAADTALESGLTLAMERAVYGNVAPVMSLSFGECESNLGSTASFLSQLWEQAAAQGITVMVSSGDSGSAQCDSDDTEEYAIQGQAVSGFASTPYNVAVGGTDFYYSAYNQGSTALNAQIATYWTTTPSNNAPAVSIKGVIPEQPWNNSQYGLTIATVQNGAHPSSTTIAAGGGGASKLYPKPAWQAGAGVPADSARDLPDLSLFASNGSNASYIPICASDGDCQPVSSGGTVQIFGVGGTSASSPSFAGIMALINQKYGPQGQADYVLYPLATQFPAVFNDVVNGTNTVPCEEETTNCIDGPNPVMIVDQDGESITEGEIGSGTTAWYNATAGYDEASGLGTIDVDKLVSDWNQVTFTKTTTTMTPSSTSVTHGTAITVSGNVTAGSSAATGNVALMTGSTEPGQQGQGLPSLLSGSPSTFPLTSGAYSGAIATLPGGTYDIWASYGGSATDSASQSTPVQITVSPEASGILFDVLTPTNGDIVPGNNPSLPYGTQLNLSAQVAPSSDTNCLNQAQRLCTGFTEPTGTIAFEDNGSALNTAAINMEGDAEYSAPFKIGSHSVTAAYSGDNSYKASTASAISFSVTQDTPNIFLGASNETGDTEEIQVIGGTGQPTVFNVLIENGTQSNSVGNRVPVAAPSGTISFSVLPSIAGVPSSATLSPGLDPSTGAVAGIAAITVPASTPLGFYSATISYSGDANYANVPGESGTIDIVSSGLTPTTTTATASGSLSPSSSIVVTGSVTGTGSTAPTGNVYVYSSGNYYGGATLSPGSGDVSTFSFALNSENLARGVNFVTLQYFGSNTYAPSAYTLSTAIQNPLSDFTLVPSSPLVTVTAGSSGSTSINLASMNGFSGAVSLTCTAATGVTCSIPTSESLASGGMASATLMISAASSTVSGNYNVSVTGKDSTGKYIHTLGIEAAVANATPTFALSNSGSIAVSPGATTGNTSTITITPSNGFTGSVALSCTIVNPPGGITPPTCSIPTPASITAATPVTTTLTIDSSTSTTPGAYQFSVTGTSGSISQSTTLNVTINAAPTFSMSNSGAVSITQGGTGTSTIMATPSTGFTGTVALTCAVTTSPASATSPVTCSLNPASVSIAGATPANSILTVVSTGTTTTGSYVVTVTGTSGTITQTSIVNVTVNPVVVGSYALSSNPATLSLTAGATTGNTSAISVTPSGGFTGTVDLTCAVTGPTGATSPVTCSLNPTAADVTSANAVVPTLTVASTATTTAGSYTITVTGTDGGTVETSTVTVTVNAAPAASYALTNSGGITVSPGAISGNTTLVTITGSNGFTGTVDLTCAITPTAASDPATCGLAAASVQVSPTVIPSVVVTVNSTAATTGKNDMKKMLWPSAGGATLALVLFFGIPRRRKWLAMLGLLIVIVAGAGIGCGGVNNTGGGGGNTGTTPGTYTVTVTGTSGTITQTTTVTLTVN